MKKFNFLVGVIWVCLGLFSCNNDESVIDDKTHIDEAKYSPQLFARTLAKSLKNEDLRGFIKGEVSKQRDGDYDVLLAEVIDQEVTPSSVLRSGQTALSFKDYLVIDGVMVRTASVKNEDVMDDHLSLAVLLKDLENNYPLLQIAIPNMETASWESIASGQEPFFVAFLSADYEEGEDVLAYDQDGIEHVLDGKIEPKTPVIVISRSERITSVLKAEDKGDYQNFKNYFENQNRIFYSLGYEKDEVKTDNLDLRYSSGGLTIWKAAFASQSAMKQYEPWTKGRPEVAVTVANGATSVDKEFGDKGWWDANVNVLNYRPGLPFVVHSSDGYRQNYYAMYFGWWELDFEFSLKKKTQTIPVYNSNGFKFSVIVPVGWLGDSNDFIGYNYVNMFETKQKFETRDGEHGSGDLYFWLN